MAAAVWPTGFYATGEALSMPQGSKSAYTQKQKRQARHIESSVRSRGGSTKRAKRIAYATINKRHGGGRKSGSGRKASSRRTSKRPSRSR